MRSSRLATPLSPPRPDGKAGSAPEGPGVHRIPEMKAYTLPKEDVDALVAYLSAMKKK
jgi:hypothetical protein